MASSPPSPSPAGVFSGCALAIALHLAVSLAIILIGGAVAREGFYVVFLFWIFLGAFQWIYLYPAIRLSRSRGWPGIVLGLWIAGGLALALNLLQLAMGLIPVAMEKLSGNTPPNVTYSGADSRVVSTDAGHIVVRAGLGDAVSPAAAEAETYVVDTATKFDFRGPAWRDQTRVAGMEVLTPGRQVHLDYVFRNHERVATFVTIWVEKKEF